MMIVTRLIYDSQGRYADAEPLYARALQPGRIPLKPPRDRQPADGHSGGGGQRPEGPLDQSRHYHHDCLSSAARLFLEANISITTCRPLSAADRTVQQQLEQLHGVAFDVAYARRHSRWMSTRRRSS